MMLRPALAAAVVLAAGAAAAAPAAAAPHSFTIVIDKMHFGSPPAKLRPGDTIMFVNRDLFQHSATAADRSFDLDLAPGARAKATMRRAGALAVACKYHPGMRTILRVGR